MKAVVLQVLLTLSSIFVIPPDSFALTAFEEGTRGIIEEALGFSRTQSVWLNANSGVFEGIVTNSQAGTKQVERRLGAGGGFGIEIPVQNNFSLRSNLQAELIKKRRVDSNAPEAILDQTYLTATPSAGFTYLTPAGLELYSGLNSQLLPTTTQYIDTENGTSKTTYGNAFILAPYLGVTRKANGMTVGFFYSFGKESKRTVKKESSDGSEVEFEQYVQLPTKVGVYGAFSGAGAIWAINGQSISEGEGGDRTEAGTPTKDDHLRIRLDSLWQGLLDLGIGYQTARYSKSTYIDLDSIPLFNMRAVILTKDEGRLVNAGLSCTVGRDKQSIPEINASYEVNACSLIGGVRSAF